MSIPPLGGGGGVAMKAERLRRLVLPAVRTCSPSEEGTLHLWMGGLVVRPLGWGYVGGGGGSSSGHPPHPIAIST